LVPRMTGPKPYHEVFRPTVFFPPRPKKLKKKKRLKKKKPWKRAKQQCEPLRKTVKKKSRARGAKLGGEKKETDNRKRKRT